MLNRRIKYGYKLYNANIVIKEDEAKIVKWIFAEFIKGFCFRQISEKLVKNNIEYYDEQCNWSNRKVARIIKDNSYMGNCIYPKIIEKNYYEQANKSYLKNSETQHEKDQNIELLNDYLYCEQCGNKYKRITNKNKKEQWFCLNGCYVDKKLSDIRIKKSLKSIIAKASKCIETFIENFEIENLKDDLTVKKCNNEIANILKSKDPNYNLGKNLIYKSISIKFRECKENRSLIYKDKVKEAIEKFLCNKDFDFSLIKDGIEKIYVTAEEKLKVVFINGMVISE